MAATTRTLLLVGPLLLLTSPARLDAQDEPGPVFTVRLDDRTGVDRGTLKRACEMVARVYSAAGVVVRWRGCAGLAEAITTPLTTIAVVPVPIAHERTAGRGVLGIAALTTSGIGRLAYVFHDRIAAFARRRGHDQAVALALVMTHELGHLLLPHTSHEEVGVMKPRWAFDDLVAASQGQLRFSPEQAATMRARLRAELQASREEGPGV